MDLFKNSFDSLIRGNIVLEALSPFIVFSFNKFSLTLSFSFIILSLLSVNSNKLDIRKFHFECSKVITFLLKIIEKAKA